MVTISSKISFALRHAFQGFNVGNILLVYAALFLTSAWWTNMLDKHIPSIMVCITCFKILVGMSQEMMVGGHYFALF